MHLRRKKGRPSKGPTPIEEIDRIIQEEDKPEQQRTEETQEVLACLSTSRVFHTNIRQMAGGVLDDVVGNSTTGFFSPDVVGEMIPALAEKIKQFFDRLVPVVEPPFDSFIAKASCRVDFEDIADSFISEMLNDEEWISRRTIRKEKEAKERARAEREAAYE